MLSFPKEVPRQISVDIFHASVNQLLGHAEGIWILASESPDNNGSQAVLDCSYVHHMYPPTHREAVIQQLHGTHSTTPRWLRDGIHVTKRTMVLW